MGASGSPPAAQGFACIGAANWDHKLRLLQDLALATSNPVESVAAQAGGVVRNVAQNLARLGHAVQLVCPVGDDDAGRALLAQARAVGLDTRGCVSVPGVATGSYTAVLDEQGDMRVAFSDMTLFQRLPPSHWQAAEAAQRACPVTVIDLNLPAPGVAQLLHEARALQRPLAAVAVSAPKMQNLPHDLRGLDLLVLNLGEWHTLLGGDPAVDAAALDKAAHWAPGWARLQARGLRQAVVTLGAQGAVCLGPAGTAPCHVKPLHTEAGPVQDVTGAGDALAAGTLHGLYGKGLALRAACEIGMAQARATLLTPASALAD